MEIKDAIRARRSVRRFLDKPVPQEAMDALIEALLWAPSAGNLQARFFYFVLDAGLKKRLAVSALSQMFISSVPLVVVACGDYERIRHYGERGSELYVIEDVAVAGENLMLQATGAGLGSVWVGAFDEDAVRDVLDIPGRLRPMAIIPIGYPAHDPLPPRRLSKDELVKVIR